MEALSVVVGLLALGGFGYFLWKKLSGKKVVNGPGVGGGGGGGNGGSHPSQK